MLDLIINTEEIRLLFYGVALAITTIATERYIEYKYKPFDDENGGADHEKSDC